MRAVDSLNDSPPPQVYANLKDRGAIILTATRDEMQGDYYFVSTIKEPSYDPACQKALKVGAWASRGGPVLHAACSGGVVPLAGALSALVRCTSSRSRVGCTCMAVALPECANRLLAAAMWGLNRTQSMLSMCLSMTVMSCWGCRLQVTAGETSRGLQNATCTDPNIMLYTFYTGDDPLPQVSPPASPMPAIKHT